MKASPSLRMEGGLGGQTNGNPLDGMEPGDSMRGFTGYEQVLTTTYDASDIKDAQPMRFALPVDSENKATELRVWKISQPHMAAFHISWMAFFTSFFSTFAASPMLPIIRDDLDMTVMDLANTGIAAVTGDMCMRLCMGAVCDIFGPRLGVAILMLITTPAVAGMSVTTSAIGFILCRFVIGFSMSCFVACQFWSSVMFSPKIVGVANATAGGWGNLGGGFTQFTIPAVYAGLLTVVPSFTAWRYAFFLPAGMHIIIGTVCLFLGQDLPDGQYSDLKKSGNMAKADGRLNVRMAVTNYRAWVMLLIYGYSFGVELTMNNIAASYFFDQFDLDLKLAGVLASLFGLMNLFARSMGGLLSDTAARRFGMRGRLWALWTSQSFAGVMCVMMGLAKDSLSVTLVFMVSFSVCVQCAEGTTFGVVPFISRRALGVVSGMVGAGGSLGSVVTLSLLFRGGLETSEGIMYMGFLIIVMTSLVGTIHFPMWGGMFTRRDEKNTTEEQYYQNDFTEDEKAKGTADVVLKFAESARQSENKEASPDPSHFGV